MKHQVEKNSKCVENLKYFISNSKITLNSFVFEAEQLEVFGRLDELASANLQTFIKELVGILADTGELSHRRIGAAKEIKRHLSSECRFVSDMQKQEWFNVPQIERISIQNKVSDPLKIIVVCMNVHCTISS